MEEAASIQSIDIPPPEPLQWAAQSIAGAERQEAPAPPPILSAAIEEDRSTTPELPPHPVIQMTAQELQEHRDAILQQQMLGRQLLSELTRRHITKHHQ